MPIEYVVRGSVVDAAGVEAVLGCEPKKRAASTAVKRTYERDKATVSAGFVVLGYSAAQIESVGQMYAEAIKRSEADEKAKHPGTIDEYTTSWKRKNKRKRIGRPYPLASSADVCAELAVKAGWLDVVVEEVMKG